MGSHQYLLQLCFSKSLLYVEALAKPKTVTRTEVPVTVGVGGVSVSKTETETNRGIR